MYATIDSHLFERAERAERKHHAKEYVEVVRTLTPVLLHVSKVVQEQWVELPLARQDEIVTQRNTIVASLENVTSQLPKGFLKSVGRTLYSLQLSIYQPELRRFAVAIAMFINAVDSATAAERKAIRNAETELFRHPERAVVAEGETIDFDPGDLLRTG